MTTRRILAGAAVLALTVGGAGSAQSNFSVDPLVIELDNATNNAVLTLSNPTSTEIRFEIKAFGWDQGPDGRPALSPTTDIVVFPPLVTVKPKGIQRVRVGTQVKPGTVEKAYRMTIEQLPSGVAPATTNTVAIRTRVGVPVFIVPDKPTRKGEIGAVTIAKHQVNVPLVNTGTLHAIVDAVTIRGMSGPDETVWEADAKGWYVLAGKTRTFTHTFTANQCRPTKYVEIEVYAHDKVLTKRADMPAGACTP